MAQRLAGSSIFRFDAPVFFANARTFREQVRALADGEPRPRWIVVAAEPITDVDITAADMLLDLDLALNADGVNLVFAELKDPVRRKIDRYELTPTIEPSHFFPRWRPRSRRSKGDGGAVGPRDGAGNALKGCITCSRGRTGLGSPRNLRSSARPRVRQQVEGGAAVGNPDEVTAHTRLATAPRGV